MPRPPCGPVVRRRPWLLPTHRYARARLQHLCRCLLRPRLAATRRRWLGLQILVFSLKTPCDDGTGKLVVLPHEQLERLAALVPPPRRRLSRYHGVLASPAADRGQLVPAPLPGPATAVTTPRALGSGRPWLSLLSRVFRLDLSSPACDGPLRLIAALTDPDSIRTYLEGVGLDSSPLPIAPARLSSQPEFDFAA